jgi:uncharacterized protein with ParB-like and HNH nuclease domain
MSTVQIIGKEYYLKDIFGDGFRFSVPRYQRPYAWTTEETEELHDDLWTACTADKQEVAKKDPYFLGSIVLVKEEHQSKSEIIDGQQRLTTLTILMSVLRHLLPDEANAISDYLRQKGKIFEGMKDEFRLTLRFQDAEFFEKHIQQENGLSALEKLNPGGLCNDAQRNIQANALYLLKKLKQKSDEELRVFTGFIVTKSVMVVVSTPDLESAYRIFCVMNDRGLNLSHADILKAEVIGKISGEENQDAYGKKWETAEENLGREAFNDLFAHIRMIRVKQKLHATILKEIREYIKPGENPTKFIDDQLVPYANGLKTIKDADYQSSLGAEKVNVYLKWLNKVDNFDWVPPAIVALSKHENNPEWLGWFFQQLERLAACMLIMRYGINDRLERYGSILQAFEDNDDVSLAAKLAPTEREKQKVINNLNGDIYEMSKVRLYVLLRLDTLLSGGGAVYDYPTITIEHVLPQTTKKGSKWQEWFPEQVERDGWIHRLSNLVLLTRKKNSEAQNYDFETKKEKYFKSDKGVCPFVLTTQVLGAKEWSPDLLQDRQQTLLDKLRELWSLEAWDIEDDERGEVESGTDPRQTPTKVVPERYDIRERFWARLLEKAMEKTKLHVNISPGHYGWVGAGSGKRGVTFNYAVREHETQVELYIDRGKDAASENKAIFDQLHAQKSEIETVFGDDLEWQRLDDRRACRIRKVINLGGWRDPEQWVVIHEAATAAMARLEKALKPQIVKL